MDNEQSLWLGFGADLVPLTEISTIYGTTMDAVMKSLRKLSCLQAASGQFLPRDAMHPRY